MLFYLIVLFGLLTTVATDGQARAVSYTEFKQLVRSGKVASVTINQASGQTDPDSDGIFTGTVATVWSAERVARLNMVELRQLKDNALRLGEPEIATLCDDAMTKLRRDAFAARKTAPPKPKKVAREKVPQE